MAKYDLLQEFDRGPAPDLLSTNPHWIVAVIRFHQPLTLSRPKLLSGSTSVSYDQDNGTVTKTKSILILDDCLSLSVTSSKDSHVWTLQAAMAGSKNYLSEILPSDWVFAWIVNSEAKANDLKSRIKQFQPCNAFDDGLKFIGRVQSIRKSLNIDPTTGLKMMRYQLQALGGREFDSMIFYDPQLAEEEASIGQYLAKLGIALTSIFDAASEDSARGEGGISGAKMISTLISLILGKGVPARFAAPGGLQIAEGLTSVEEAQYAYAVPHEVGELLGRPRASKHSGVYSFADIFDLLIGIQKYSSQEGNSVQSLAVFIPDGLVKDSVPEYLRRDDDVQPSNRWATPKDLKGTYQPRPVPLVNVPVWSVLDQFLNPTINEMYYTLRVNPEGRVVPTLVARQLPFSTPSAAGSMGNDATGFLELPRWVAHPALVESFDVGRSDATHFNFVHVYGQASAEMSGLGMTEQIIRSPPIRDEQDIKRNGIHPYMETVSCSINDTVGGPKVWMSLIADFLMGQQFTLNGTIAMRGISAPICPGDNLEFDDTVYHIETVAHLCSIDPLGHKSFTTALSLTHGLRSDSKQAQGRVPPSHSEDIPIATPAFDPSALYTDQTTNATDVVTHQAVDNGVNPDLYIYSGIAASDGTAHDPGLTVENNDG